MIIKFNELVKRVNAYKGIPPSVTDLYLAIKKYLPNNPTILEAGAHMGYDTYGLTKIWPKGKVYAFEPIPSVYMELVTKVKDRTNVRTFNLALGNQNGTLEMFVSGGASTASSSLLPPTEHMNVFPQVTFQEKVLVPTKKMSDWAKEENVSRIDLLWLDMQGFEVYALMGAGDLLKNVKVIYTELCKKELYSGMFTQDKYIDFLEKAGFTLVSVVGDDEVSDGIFVRADKKIRSL